MPKYTFTCPKCLTSRSTFTSSRCTSIKCESCNADMSRELPTLNGPANTTEVVDKFLGTIQKQDQNEIIKERKEEHYWTVEVPRMVNSGTYSIETCLENGWISINDKREIVINNKPPNKR